MDILKKFSQRLKQIRIEAGLTQMELAQLTNLSTNYISLLERGKRSPSLPTIDLLAKRLGVPLKVLLDIDENEEESTPARAKADYREKLNRLLMVRDSSEVKLVYEVAKKILCQQR